MSETLPIGWQIFLGFLPPVVTLGVALLAVRETLKKVQVERAFDRKREWYEKTMETVSELYHRANIYHQNYDLPGAAEKRAEMHDALVRSGEPVIRLTFGARLYADFPVVSA